MRTSFVYFSLKWDLYPTTAGSADFGQVPAVDTHVFPDYPECRPDVEITDELVGSRLILNTDGRDLLEVVPDQLTLFPYSFTSSLPQMARSAPADKSKTKNGAKTVLQSLPRAYYGGCRVRAVNTTGIYIEDTCEISNHWLNYGLMVHSPGDIPLCSTGDVCIHNYFNSLWEWQHYIDPVIENRVGMNLNTFRSRYADTVAISVLPGVVVMQILLMAQITYHLVYNSDLYMLGLATGTLTGKSIANLTCCFFTFSYSFVNLLKARCGDQQLDRHFRLVWEAMQFGTTNCVGSLLLSWQKAPFESILSKNSEILRKTSARGAKYCGLNDACVLFKVNSPSVIAVISVALGVFAVISSFLLKMATPKVKKAIRSARLSLGSLPASVDSAPSQKVSASGITAKKQALYDGTSGDDQLTSFERNCIGTSFHRLFWDCDDIAHVTYGGKNCMTVEALLLTGYLYYGEHIYQASSVMLLLLARVIPSKVLRTFNVLLLRWHVDPNQGTLSHAMSCTCRRRADPADDKSGDISLSVEETNKLRASLGLKPLALGPSKQQQAVVSVQKSGAQLDAEREQRELQRRLQQSRTRRALTQKLAGPSLGEQLQADAEAQQLRGAREWVKQSREKKQQQQEKEEEKKQKKKKLKEENYDAAALAGMAVGHALDSFEDGQEVVLTLKDARVLGDDGNDLNDAEDELVNVELSEKDKRRELQARAKRAAMPVYSGYDDDEFIQMGSSRKRKSGTKLLAQYDEEQDVADAAEERKFRLDATGGPAAVESERKQEDDDEVAVISLAMDRNRQVEDYYTKEEVEAQFAKHKSKKLRKKKKKSRRQRDEDLGENDAVEVQLSTGAAEASGDAASLVAQLEQEALQAGASGSKDRGKRKRSRRDDDEDPEEEENLLRFQEAREKANAVASEALAASSGKRRMKRRPIDDSEIVDDAAAIEMELGASLARARQLAKQQTQSLVPVAPTTSEARIAQLVGQTISNEEDTTPAVATDSVGDIVVDSSATTTSKPVGQVFGEVGTAANTVVFNEATDFETRLRDAMEKRAAQFQAAASGTAAPTTSVSGKSQQATVTEEKKHEEDMEIDEEKKEEDNGEDGETNENEVWGEEQPLVGTGMGATLALLRKTGDLRETRVERQAGRANDARDRNFEDDLRIKNGVKLDYRDEFGRLLTKKEAFRMLSYKFHGHEPGKKKKEKRLKQLKEELEAQKLLSGEGTSSATMASSTSWQWTSAIANRVAPWWPSVSSMPLNNDVVEATVTRGSLIPRAQVDSVGLPVVLELTKEKEHLVAKNRDAQVLIADLKKRLKRDGETITELKHKLVELKKEKQKYASVDIRDAQTLIDALKERLKTEQDAKTASELKVAELRKLQKGKLAEMQRLHANDKVEIAKLKKRFNQRKVAAEISNLEKEVANLNKQVAVLKMKEKVYDKNRLLALQVSAGLLGRHLAAAQALAESHAHAAQVGAVGSSSSGAFGVDELAELQSLLHVVVHLAEHAHNGGHHDELAGVRRQRVDRRRHEVSDEQRHGAHEHPDPRVEARGVHHVRVVGAVVPEAQADVERERHEHQRRQDGAHGVGRAVAVQLVHAGDLGREVRGPAVGHEQVEHEQRAAHEPHDEPQAGGEPPAAPGQARGGAGVVAAAAALAVAALERDAAEVDRLVLVHQVGQLVAHEQQHGRHAGVEGEHGLRAGAAAVDARGGHHGVVEHEAQADERLQHIRAR
ncbi:unnamed protein product [Phytophthora fragariaefolia]|uniref:Unnamed protein product n=1 Tax=Phytophthora fragariaefolia TaxID=1490495 RepID=A0A9W6X4R6_9STRA|nr:unnamed protein product [Phytophthora fragariaefolia]